MTAPYRLQDATGSRWYRDTAPDGAVLWRPGTTSVIAMLAKGEGFEQWLVNNAHRAEQLRKDSAAKGTILHQACEALLHGRRVCTTGLDATDVKRLTNFVRFCEMARLETLATERFFLCPDPAPWGYAGTFDVRVRFGKTVTDCHGAVIEQGEEAIIDLKSGKGPYPEQFMQISAYCFGTRTPVGALFFLRERGLGLHRVEVEKWWQGFIACHELFCLTHAQPVVPPPLPTHIEPPDLTEISITEATMPQGCKHP